MKNILKKKKKKKGFTLIELLAIIVILAIIMVVTIPSVLGMIEKAKIQQFKNSVDIVADWVEKQYQMASNDIPGVSDAFLGVCNDSNGYCTQIPTCKNEIAGYVSTSPCGTGVGAPDSFYSYYSATEHDSTPNVLNDNEKNFLISAGVDPSSYSRFEVVIKNNKKTCVRLFSNSGDFDYEDIYSGGYLDIRDIIYIKDLPGKTYSYEGRVFDSVSKVGSTGNIIYMESSGCE